MSVTEELVKKLKLKPKEGETSEDFSKRAHQKITALSDSGWEDLTAAAQGWYNAFSIAGEKKTNKTAMDIEKEILDSCPGLKPGVDETAEDFIKRVTYLELPEVEEQHKAAEKETAVAKSEHSTKSTGESEKVGEKKAEKKASDKKPVGVKSVGVKGRPRLAPPEARIKLLVPESPYRAGCLSDKAFRKYKDGMTVAQAMAIPEVTYACIVMDKRNGLIAIEGP
jgi:hypothetical protein